MDRKTRALLEARLTAQLLSGPPATDPVAIAERLLAIQGQDPRGARLAIRARSEGLRAADIDRALSEDRTLVITTVNRGTLHLIRSEDYSWLHALTTPQLLTGNLRRLEQEGVSPEAAERGVETIEGALADEGPMISDQLRDRIAAAGVRTEGQAFVHIVGLATLRGLVARGPIIDGKHAFVLVRDWLGEAKPLDRESALGELARRFLVGHGPASDRDLAYWAGINLGDARAGLGTIASELDDLGDGSVRLASSPAAKPLPAPKLLGPFDPILHGWTSREAVLGPHQHVVTRNGIFKPFALVGGRAVATWRMPGGEVVLEPFGQIAKAHSKTLEAEAADIARFLG